jgi:serine/threonine protein kinase
LKTKNVLLTDDWQIKIADFGMARADTQTNQSMLGKICGTIGYSAPEIFYGTACTTKSDIYSLGIILWEFIVKCMTGNYLKPYQEYSYINMELQILYQAAEMGLRPTLPKNCPELLADLVRRCWSADPNDRPDAEEIQDFLLAARDQYSKEPQRWDSLRGATASQ